MTTPAKWDVDTDVCVLGSGGSALTAAILAHDSGARVVVLEKSGMVGGTTAMSGGVLWIPGNHHMKEAGVADSWDDAVSYLDSLAPGLLDPDTLEAFLTNGPEMVRYMEEHTPVRLHLFTGYPDYHPDRPGSKPTGGRSLDNDVFPFEELGTWATRVNQTGPSIPASMVEAMSPGGLQTLGAGVLDDRRQRDCRGSGQALVGSLLKGVLDRGIEIRLETRARSLVQAGGRVVGVAAEHAGETLAVRAAKGVIIGTGGFEWNRALVQTFLSGPMTAPASPPDNEGDGLLMAMEVGAALGNMTNAWWMPCVKQAEAHRRGVPTYRLCLAERTLPRSFVVNRTGRRFMNEAANYNTVGRAMHRWDENRFDYVNLPAWLIFDQVYKDRYMVFGCPPGEPAPAWFRRAETLEDLAAIIEVDPAGLSEQAQRFNADARAGRDSEFHRGDSVYDHFNGDRSQPAPFCTLGEVDTGPFYAVQIESGCLGTNGGPKTNGKAQVLGLDGQVIPGLYAVGNTMAGATGRVYGGAGGTIGPGMTFGYIAGREAAREAV
ncbi:MAG: FAD-dependent oxidoreductase [Dehalococcoidia bacterium]|nr:FAD-dependent oxidoreductase [Dehalococcoidia bacterium]